MANQENKIKKLKFDNNEYNFDDLPENHVHANALGMRTVLIHWGEEIADALDHITDSVHDVTTWLKAHLHRQKKTDAIDTPKPPQP